MFTALLLWHAFADYEDKQDKSNMNLICAKIHYYILNTLLCYWRTLLQLIIFKNVILLIYSY